MPSRVRIWAGACETSVSWKVMAPPSIGRVPASRENRVVLPAPLGPMMPRISPSSTSKETSPATTSAPNAFDSPDTLSTVPAISTLSGPPVGSALAEPVHP